MAAFDFGDFSLTDFKPNDPPFDHEAGKNKPNSVVHMFPKGVSNFTHSLWISLPHFGNVQLIVIRIDG